MADQQIEADEGEADSKKEDKAQIEEAPHEQAEDLHEDVAGDEICDDHAPPPRARFDLRAVRSR
jgi:hypothetical protein